MTVTQTNESRRIKLNLLAEAERVLSSDSEFWTCRSRKVQNLHVRVWKVDFKSEMIFIVAKLDGCFLKAPVFVSWDLFCSSDVNCDFLTEVCSEIFFEETRWTLVQFLKDLCEFCCICNQTFPSCFIIIIIIIRKRENILFVWIWTNLVSVLFKWALIFLLTGNDASHWSHWSMKLI